MNILECQNVDNTVRIYGDPKKCTVGRNCRIDAFCVISIGDKGIEIGDDVHIGCGVYLFGGGGKITIGDGCSLSPRSTIYTSTDQMSKSGLIGACNPISERNIKNGSVTMLYGSALATGSIVMPGVTIGVGSVLGALSMLRGDVPDGTIYSALDVAHLIGDRSTDKS